MDYKYIRRVLDSKIKSSLKKNRAICLYGPKGCGKCTSMKRIVKNVADFSQVDQRNKLILEANMSPDLFLSSPETPLLINEYKYIPLIIKHVNNETILTSSSKTDILVANDIYTLYTRPLSLFETKDSNGSVSIHDLKDNIFSETYSELNIKDYAKLICHGGWPFLINKDNPLTLQEYYDNLISNEVYSLDNYKINKNPSKANKVLKAYSKNISKTSSEQIMLEDCVSDGVSFDKETFYKYLNAYRDLFIIEELPAWIPALKNKTVIRNKPARYLVDPSLSALALNITERSISKDISIFESLFKSLAIRDLRTYCDVLDAKVYKYRDAQKRETDAVIVFSDNSYALVDITLGDNNEIERLADILKDISKDINNKLTGKQRFNLIITKEQKAYKRQDGIYVVPLGCLRN